MDIGYHIVTKQPFVVDFYENARKGDTGGFHEYFQQLRRTFSGLNPANYRGISRLPLLPVPEEFQASWGTIDEPQAQFLLEVRIEETCDRLGDEEIDMLGSLEDALEVFSLIGNKERFELLRVSKTDMEQTPETIGYEIGYWGGDNFSAISDSVLLPMWHGAQPTSFEKIRPFVARLNPSLLFGTPEDAKSFRKFYLSQDWAETEITENQICVQKVELLGIDDLE